MLLLIGRSRVVLLMFGGSTLFMDIPPQLLNTGGVVARTVFAGLEGDSIG